MTITRFQYLQLTGLLVLAKGHNDALKDIATAALLLTQEKDDDGQPDDMGHTYDGIYCSYSADELIRKLGLTVEETV